jgi:hypothetical protein
MLIAVVPKHGGILLAAWREVKFDDAGGLAEIFALAWVFIALVIGEVGLNILRWFTLGFDYAGNGFRPSTGCAGPSCKPRVFLKTEPSARRCHDDSFPQAGVDYQPMEIHTSPPPTCWTPVKDGSPRNDQLQVMLGFSLANSDPRTENRRWKDGERFAQSNTPQHVDIPARRTSRMANQRHEKGSPYRAEIRNIAHKGWKDTPPIIDMTRNDEPSLVYGPRCLTPNSGIKMKCFRIRDLSADLVDDLSCESTSFCPYGQKSQTH